jgi:hypothetical protein
VKKLLKFLANMPITLTENSNKGFFMETSNIGSGIKHQPHTQTRAVRNEQGEDENNRRKKTKPSGENSRKGDTVTISEEGKNLSLGRIVKDPSLGLVFERGDFGKPEWKNMVINRLTHDRSDLEEWLKKSVNTSADAMPEEEINANQPSYADYSLTSVSHRIGAEEFILNSLDGKAGNASKEVANQLASMIFSTKDTDLETQAANREAARDLAKRIAETYMSDPKEAQAFIDEINKRIEDSELIDKGYVNSSKGLTPPDPMDDHDRFILANWDKYFGHLGISPKVNEFNKLDWNGSGVPIEEIGKALHSARKDFIEEALAHFQKVNTPQKFWPDGSEGPSWEEKKEMNTRYSMYNEENKAWYADFLAKSNLVQNIINNAKLITDFSGNERWNMVMNLLTAQQGDK